MNPGRLYGEPHIPAVHCTRRVPDPRISDPPCSIHGMRDYRKGGLRSQSIYRKPSPASMHASSPARPAPLRRAGGSKIMCQGDPASLIPIARRLQRALWEDQGIGWALRAEGPGFAGSGVSARITLDSDRGIPAQGYRLRIDDNGVDLVAGDVAGAFYGGATLVQMLRQCDGVLPAGEISDSPDFPSRGVMLDISRSKVPTLATLFDLVDLLSGWKINHLDSTRTYLRLREPP